MTLALEKLINAAEGARERAYAPYSGFKVGAALATTEGRVYSGCNVENASFGLTVCAERVALFKAVSAGERDFAVLALVATSDDICPCGACLQVLAEFAPRLKLVLPSPGGYRETTLEELLPCAFRLTGHSPGETDPAGRAGHTLKNGGGGSNGW
ncbi:MAG TPA: cytidine deaminase [Spirochaetia bacterium]|nr:cytidine deaminase [Spirochaetia bacterium]